MQPQNETMMFQAKVGDGPSTDYVFRCELNDSFGLALQGILAFTAFCILICKFSALCQDVSPIKCFTVTEFSTTAPA